MVSGAPKATEDGARIMLGIVLVVATAAVTMVVRAATDI